MSVAPEFYIRGDSWLHTADPRAKLLLLALTLLLLLIFQNLVFMFLAWLLILLLLWTARVPRERITFVFKALLPVTILMPLIWIFVYPQGEVVLSFGFVNIRGQSLALGIMVVLRIQAITFAVFALLFTTDENSLAQGLVRLRVPYSWGLTLTLALRYIPNFADSYNSILQAQQARGLEYLNERGLGRVRALMPVLVPMVIQSFRASEQMGIALEARGYGVKGVQRTYLNAIRFRTTDWLIVIVGVAVAAAVLLALIQGSSAGAGPLWPLG